MLTRASENAPPADYRQSIAALSLRQRYVKGLLFRVVPALLFGALFSLCATLGIVTWQTARPALLVLAALALVNCPYWYAGKWAGFPPWQFYIHWLGDLIGITLIIYCFGGIDMPMGQFGYLMMIHIAAVLVSRRAAVFVATAATLAYACLGAAEIVGWLPSPGGVWSHHYDTNARLFIVGISAVLFYCVAYISGVLADMLQSANEELASIKRDVEEQNQALEERVRVRTGQLQRSEAKLRSLALREAEIREEERKRVSFDLHDGVCQELVGNALVVDSIRRYLPPMHAERASDLHRVANRLNEMAEHLRVLSRDLHPMDLHDFGLETGLRKLARNVSLPDAHVEVFFTTTIPRVDEATAIGIYRIAQEALLNAARHAQARALVLTLAVADDTLSLEVQDDGRGFDPEDVAVNALGIKSMEERALALGGKLRLWSEPGKGTRVSMQCPCVTQRSKVG